MEVGQEISAIPSIPQTLALLLLTLLAHSSQLEATSKNKAGIGD
jgi:hypothetical protein